MPAPDFVIEPWPRRKPDITTAIADATDHLITARTLSKMKREGPMNKFAELAARSVSIRKSLDERADRLSKRLDAIPALADTTLGKHERLMDETEQGIQALEESLRDMVGHNGSPLPLSSEG